MKVFNTTSVCIPSKHYMVDLSERVEQIKRMVDAGAYFTMNRARQYGKTTTLYALREHLAGEYDVITLDFQGIGEAGFSTEEKFVQEFSRLLWNFGKWMHCIPKDVLDTLKEWKDTREPWVRLGGMFDLLMEWCEKADRRIVLLIDEVDTATNNQVFLDFLAQLREKYILRDTFGIKTFQSVILAGVTDVKHLRGKIRDEEQHKVNSPWNIAADFDIDMSLSEDGIRGMLEEYEEDHHTQMDPAVIAKEIRDYTKGYPFLVSRICQIVDTKLVPGTFPTLSSAWTPYGIDEAVKRILQEDNSFFDSCMGKLENYPELKRDLQRLLFRGETIPYLPDDREQRQLRMYGLLVNNHNTISVSNKIFEMRLYQYFLGENRRG